MGAQPGRTDDEGAVAAVFLECFGNGGGDHGFAKTDDIADDDSALLPVQTLGGKLDGAGLKGQQDIFEFRGNGEVFGGVHFLVGEMPSGFDVDVVGVAEFSRPTFVDNFSQFVGDVQTQAVVPALFKPLVQFFGGIVFGHIHIEFAIVFESGKGEVAAAEESDDGDSLVAAVDEIEFGVQGMAGEEFNAQAGDGRFQQLLAEFLQGCAVGVSGGAEHELRGELLGSVAASLVGDRVGCGVFRSSAVQLADAVGFGSR